MPAGVKDISKTREHDSVCSNEGTNAVPIRLTPKQARLVSGTGRLVDDANDARRITYSHSVMCQTSLPFKDQPGHREWKNRNGRAVVVIEAGQVYDPIKADVVQLGLPYGTKPRLILLDWNRQAILSQSPDIEVEDTLYAFLRRLQLPTEGRVYNMIKKQLSALAACQMIIGKTENDGSGSTGYGRIVSNLNVLFSKNEKQRILWPNTVTLSTDYFNSLTQHAVPLDERALYLLRDSALELDLYAMLSERLHRIPPNKPQFVPWNSLHIQYGEGYKRIRDFRSRFLKHLRNVQAVYRDARIEEIKTDSGRNKGLLLRHSSPPIRKLVVQKPATT